MRPENNQESDQNKTKINFSNEMDREYWTAFWGINDRQLKEALEASGSENSDEIEKVLRDKKYIE